MAAAIVKQGIFCNKTLIYTELQAISFPRLKIDKQTIIGSP